MSNNKNALEAFAKTLNAKAFKVVNYPSYIFLCGGQLKTDRDETPSARSVFRKHLKNTNPSAADRVLLAEEVSGWFSAASVYPNLVELEEHLAGLSSLILLFVESEGSIAELGAFSFVPALREKLTVVIEKRHYDKRSFIYQGPVTFLRQNDNDSVFSYKWGEICDGEWKFDLGLCNKAVKQLAEHLADKMKKPASNLFRSADHGHRMLLIADLIGLAGAVRKSDLIPFLEGLQLSDFHTDGTTIEQYLFLLKNLGLIYRDRYGNQDYLFHVQNRANYIAYHQTLEGRVIDRSGFRSRFKKNLPSDRDREKAYKQYKESTGLK